MGNKTKSPKDEPPVRGWRIAFLVACTVGVCLSADLLRLHINVHTDPTYVSYCAISERVNCDTLALSRYAIFAGLPLSIWGLVGYLVMAGWANQPWRYESCPTLGAGATEHGVAFLVIAPVLG